MKGIATVPNCSIWYGLFLCCLALPGCLTIEETYVFKRNGSGSMQYLIEAGEMAKLLESIKQEEDAENPLNELSMAELVPKLETIEGISQVKLIEDLELSRYGLHFKFKHIDALNHALNQIMMKDGGPDHTFFRMEGKVISRQHLMTKNTLMGEMMSELDDSERMRAVVQQVNYRLKFKFAQPVKVVYSMADVTLLGKQQKELHVESNLKELLQDAESLNTSIVLK